MKKFAIVCLLVLFVLPVFAQEVKETPAETRLKEMVLQLTDENLNLKAQNAELAKFNLIARNLLNELTKVETVEEFKAVMKKYGLEIKPKEEPEKK